MFKITSNTSNFIKKQFINYTKKNFPRGQGPKLKENV